MQHQNKIEHAIIFDPVKQEIFTASLGEGAFLNNHRIRVNLNNNLDQTVIAISGKPTIICNNKVTNNLFNNQKFINFRRMGSAALDCAYVAAGRIDAAVGIGLSFWDFAAGMLIIQEAGGIINNLPGSNNFAKTGNFIASNIELSQKLLKIWNQNEQN